MRVDSRKLFLFGHYSLALLLPKKWLTEMDIAPGDCVHLEYDRARQRVVVRPEKEGAPTKKAKLDRTSTAKTRHAKVDPTWEPIPQI